jgi:hypothetical protein
MSDKKLTVSFLTAGLMAFLFIIFPSVLYSQQPGGYGQILIASEPDYPPYCFVDERKRCRLLG